jgi:protein-S-isoprenylcysteine O-methyltransferase Ste14
MMSVNETVALITIILWPVVPLFWIPVHGLSRFFKKLGIFTYIMPLVTWLPLAYAIYFNSDFMLRFTIQMPVVVNIIGIVLLTIGTILQLWTGKLLGLLGLMGLPEISTKQESQIVARGAFAIVRHPTYLAHTLMFFGIFMMTEVITVGILTFLDFVIVNAVIIPLEEKELLNRFGKEYEEYQKLVSRKFFPKIL